MNEKHLAGNILIGRYMGVTMYYMEELGRFMYNVKSSVPAYLSNWEEMQFHSSYDWIMPVVIKLEMEQGFKIQICRKRVTVATDFDQKELFYTKEEDKIISIWEAVVRILNTYPHLTEQ